MLALKVVVSPAPPTRRGHGMHSCSPVAFPGWDSFPLLVLFWFDTVLSPLLLCNRPKALAQVPESVLKKRKTSEKLRAEKAKADLAAKAARKANRKDIYKRAET